MAYHTLRQEYMLMPPVTRAYTTVCLLTSIAVVSRTCHLHFLIFLIYILFYFLATGCGFTFPVVLQSFAHHSEV